MLNIKKLNQFTCISTFGKRKLSLNFMITFEHSADFHLSQQTTFIVSFYEHNHLKSLQNKVFTFLGRKSQFKKKMWKILRFSFFHFMQIHFLFFFFFNFLISLDFHFYYFLFVFAFLLLAYKNLQSELMLLLERFLKKKIKQFLRKNWCGWEIYF